MISTFESSIQPPYPAAIDIYIESIFVYNHVVMYKIVKRQVTPECFLKVYDDF